MRKRRTGAVAVTLGLGLTLALTPVTAQAETSDQVRQEVATVQTELEQLADQIADGEGKVQELQGQVDALASESMQLQTQIIEDRDVLGTIIAESYKSNSDARTLALLLSSQTMDELVSQVYYAQKVSDWQAECIEKLNQDKEELDRHMTQITQAKDQQKAALSSLTNKREELDAKVASLTAKADQLESDERAAAIAAAEAAAERASQEQAARQETEAVRNEAIAAAVEAGDIAPAPSEGNATNDSGAQESPSESAPAETTTSPTTSGSGWVTCAASAYTIEDNTPPGSTATASGIPLDNSVATVAMPMSMNPSRFYGSAIEISYGGVSVVATVTDCGYLSGGARGLDLTPAVFRAFGFDSADDWGVRTVSYRFL